MRQVQGFTLVEALMVIILLSVLAVGSINIVDVFLDSARFDETVLEMEKIRDAMIGNLDQKEGGKRTSFGYLGDIGAIPAAVQGVGALTVNPGVPAWAINAATRISIGWNGPYLNTGDSNIDYTTDAWGTNYLYCPAAATPMIRSCGSNVTCGGGGGCAGAADADDITFEMPAEKTTATLIGFISNSGGPFIGNAEVELNAPDGVGVLSQTQDAVVPAENGRFSFANVPFGVRSITIYVPTSAIPTTTIGPVIITVDQPNVIVPSGWIDVNP